MIIRGTTPYHNFTLPYTTEEIAELYITYLQNEEVIIEKSLDSEGVEIHNVSDSYSYENASVEESTDEVSSTSELTVHLSQEDTLSFHFYPAARKNIAVIQVRILTMDNEAYASDPIRERIMGVLKDGVIGNG